MRRTGALLALLVAGSLCAGACGKKESVSLVLLDPCAAQGKSFKDAANYTEIVVFKNGCPADSDLATGTTDGAAFTGVSARGEKLPTIGDLDKGKYGFAAIMRDANCGVIGFGCTEADLDNIREVRVAVRAWTQPDQAKLCEPLSGAGCQAPETCVAGRCTSGTDGGGGPDCDLSVVASGGLPALTGDGGSQQVSGPTVAASSAGFVIGYRTQLAGQMVARAALLTSSGTINPPSSLSLAACPGQSPSDGVGLAFSGTNGLMALALPDCDTQGAGAYFMNVDENAQLSQLKLARSPGAFKDLTLARTHSLSAAGAPDLYNFIYRSTAKLEAGVATPQIQLAPLSGNSFAGSISAKFGAEASDFGMVASTAQVMAILGRVPSKASVELDVSPPSGGSEAGAPNSFLLPDSTWGAITAWTDRAAAIAPGAGTGLTLQAATAAGSDVGRITLDGDQFSSGDIVALRDHLIIVGSSAQQLTVYRIDGAQGGAVPVVDAGSPQPDSGLSDSGPAPQPDAGGQQTGALAMGSKVTISAASLSLPDGGQLFDGHQVSIAAANDEVAVVWRTKLNPDPGAPGGWVLLKCNQ